MKLSSKLKLHPLTGGLFFLGCLTGYIKYLLAIFLLVLIHEAGHIFMAIIFKRKITSITLLPFGGLTKMDSFISSNIFEDLLIAVGGIFFGTLFGFFLLFLKNNNMIEYGTFEFLNSYNILIILFNLLPICPLDGYKITKYMSELFIPYKVTFMTSLVLGCSVLTLVIIYNLNLFYNNIFIFIFLVIMGVEEVRTRKYLMYRFYMERLNYDFDYKRKNIRFLDGAFKNRINYIDGVHEREAIGHIFTNVNR